MSAITVAAFYRFFPFTDHPDWIAPLTQLAAENGVKGTILLADEGINSTIAGPEEGINAVLDYLTADPRIEGLIVKRSAHDTMPFLRLKVRSKPEIVTFKQPDVDAANATGTHVKPADWNAIVDNPDIPVIDTRNEFEVEIGTFKGAINPHTEKFTEFAAWVDDHLDPQTTPEVAMFCTGGIRCEKASAWLRKKGFQEVFQLDGGILQYLEDMPKEESTWEGECFVFDQRVTVDHDLEAGDYELCRACWQPVSPEQRESAEFEEGISCPRCFANRTDADRARYAERMKQMNLAKNRGELHLGR